MNRGNYLLVVAFLFASTAAAQHRSFGSTTTDMFSIGIGVGFDHGGIGANAMVFPHESIGLFAGGGYAMAGLAYNVGVKLRLITYSPRIHPYILAMYGHNAAIATSNQSRNKLFYGSTFGLGIDIRPKSTDNYFSIAVLVPIKGSEVDEYVKNMNGQGISFNSSSFPLGFSISYRFAIQTNDY